jgi:hypothetical protein
VLDLLATAGVLGLLGLVGSLAALVLLGAEARTRRLDLAMAIPVCGTAAGLGVALGLGAIGRLHLGPALAVEALLAAGLAVAGARHLPLAAGSVGALAPAALKAAAGIPFLAIALVHAAGAEMLRGLLRPPLSWDSLMYHLLLAATWLRDGNLAPFFASFPNNFNGPTTANGAVWLWWWMAPSHSDLFVNLAFAAHWVLLGLAVGAVARDLGARRHWPVAAALTLLTPIVLRISATQYVDVFIAALLVAGLHFGLRWAREARWSDALLAALALGPALGAKLLVPLYVAPLAVALLLLARGRWARRALQVAVAAAVMIGLGGYFYLRNASLGLGPFFPFHSPLFPSWPACDTGPELFYPAPPSLPLRSMLGDAFWSGFLTDAFVGRALPPAMELGIGPVVLVLLLAALAGPFALSSRFRGPALVVASHVVVALAVWVVVPVANGYWILSNVRFLIGAAGLAFALGFAILETRGVSDSAISLLGAALAVQSLLLLHAELLREVRIAVAWLDVLAVVLLLSAWARSFVLRRGRWLVAAAVLASLPLAQWWVGYRHAGRYVALATEYTLHSTPAAQSAAAWAWLDVYGGDGTVAAVGEPETYFLYPDMGERLLRRVTYVNVNARDSRSVKDYPHCNPRVDFAAPAWLANLEKQAVRWVHVSRRGPDYPVEDDWARQDSDRLVLRYEDPFNRIYERVVSTPLGRAR